MDLHTEPMERRWVEEKSIWQDEENDEEDEEEENKEKDENDNTERDEVENIEVVVRRRDGGNEIRHVGKTRVTYRRRSEEERCQREQSKTNFDYHSDDVDWQLEKRV